MGLTPADLAKKVARELHRGDILIEQEMFGYKPFGFGNGPTRYYEVVETNVPYKGGLFKLFGGEAEGIKIREMHFPYGPEEETLVVPFNYKAPFMDFVGIIRSEERLDRPSLKER